MNRHSVHSSTTYQDAEHAVDWLSDHEFPVERASIVGTGLRYVERVSGRVTTGRAALLGLAYGALLGLFWGLLFALLFTFDSVSFWGLVSYSVIVGGGLGAAIRAFSHYLTNGRRDFASEAQTRADHYEVQVEQSYADEAKRVLATMPAS
jgi:hypothetical protein